jgi:hypothetical protein
MVLHQDQLIAHVWGLQLAGKKRFVFCPESEISRCTAPSTGATVDAFNSSSWTPLPPPPPPSASPAAAAGSSAAATAPGGGGGGVPSLFPDFQPSACYHVSLEAGDLVYWPSRWLHQSYQQGDYSTVRFTTARSYRYYAAMIAALSAVLSAVCCKQWSDSIVCVPLRVCHCVRACVNCVAAGRSVALSSFSLSKQIAPEFFESVSKYFEDLDPRLVAKMQTCRPYLPD